MYVDAHISKKDIRSLWHEANNIITLYYGIKMLIWFIVCQYVKNIKSLGMRRDRMYPAHELQLNL